MVFEKGNECLWFQIQTGVSSRRLLPCIRLSLIQITILCRGNKLLRTPKVVAVVGFVSTGQGNNGGMMPVVIPYSVKIIAALLSGPDQFCPLEFILLKQKDVALSRRFPRRASDSSHNIFLRVIKNGLRGIKAESVEMEFLNPVASIGDEELPDRPAIFPVEINGFTPFVFSLMIHVIVRVNTEVISIRPEVVVDDIENHA